MYHHAADRFFIQNLTLTLDLNERRLSAVMVLYATGFNAWNQLQFDTPGGATEPDDIFCFTCVLRDDAIDCVRPFFSYTCGK